LGPRWVHAQLAEHVTIIVRTATSRVGQNHTITVYIR